MMLMPTGPSAMILSALSDVNDSNEGEKMSIAKFLCVSILSTQRHYTHSLVDRVENRFLMQ